MRRALTEEDIVVNPSDRRRASDHDLGKMMKKSKRFFAKRLYYKPNSVLVPHTRGDGNQGIDTGKVENELDRRVTTHKKDAENQGENQLVYGSKRFSDDIQLVDRDPVYTGFYPTSIPHKRDHQVSSDAGVWPSMSLFTRNRLVFSDPEQVAGRESYSGAFVSTKAFSGFGETASLNNAEAGLLFSSTRTTEKWVTDASLATKTSAIQVDDSSQVRLTLRGEGKNVKTGITLDKAPIHVIRLIALLCQEARDETGYLSDLVRSSDDDDYESIYEACSKTGDYGDLFQDLESWRSEVTLITGAIRYTYIPSRDLEEIGVTLLHTASSITTDSTDRVLDAINKPPVYGRWNALWESLTTDHELRCTNGTDPCSGNPTMTMVLEQLVWTVLLYCITSPRSRYFQMIDDGENVNSGSFWSSPVKYRQLVDGYFTGSPATDEVTKNNIDPDFPMFRVMCRKDWKTVFEIVERKLIGDWETWLTPLDGFHEITAEAFKTTLIDPYMNANNLMNPTMDELLSHFAQKFGFNEDAVRMSCESSYSTANWIYGIADILERMSPHTLPDESANFAKVRRTLTWTAMTNIVQNNYRDNYRHALLRMLYPYRFHNTTKDAGVVLKKSLGNPDNLSLAPLLNPEEFDGSRNCVSLGEVHNPFLGVYALNIPIFNGVFGIGDVVTNENETNTHSFTFRCVSQHEYEPFVAWIDSAYRGSYYGFTNNDILDIDLRFRNLPRVGTDDVWVAMMKITFPDSTNINSDHPNVYMRSGYYFDERQLSSDGVSVSLKGTGVFTPKMFCNRTSPNNPGDNPLEKKLIQIQQLNSIQDTQGELDEVSQSDAMILCKDLTDLRAWCQVEIFLIRKTNRFDKYTPGDVKDVEKVIRMERTALPEYYLKTYD